MEIRPSIVWVIVGTGIVTMIPRVLPLAVLSHATLPDWTRRWLGYVTVAMLFALLAQSVMVSNGHIAMFLGNPALLATIPTLLLAIKTRSLVATVIGGITIMALLRTLLG